MFTPNTPKFAEATSTKELVLSEHTRLASESQTLPVQTNFVIWHARDIGVIGINESTNQLDYIVLVT